jgi:alkylhydroperoxidase family enzyme
MENKSAGRLPLLDPQTSDRANRETFALLPELNLFRAMANAPSLFPFYNRYLYACFQPMQLDAGLARMIVLLTAVCSECLYVWPQNVVVAKSLGVNDDQINALQLGDTTASCFSPQQQAAFVLADETIAAVDVCDTTWEAAVQALSVGAVTEVLFVVGTYMFLSRVARAGRVPLDAHPGSVSDIKPA